MRELRIQPRLVDQDFRRQGNLSADERLLRGDTAETKLFVTSLQVFCRQLHSLVVCNVCKRCRVQGSGCRVQGAGFRVQVPGFEYVNSTTFDVPTGVLRAAALAGSVQRVQALHVSP
jgi:hypothetical protein